MKILFNKKTKVVYVVLLSICFILGCVSAGLNVHYSAKFEEATSSNDLTQKVVDVISSLASSLTSNSSSTTTTADETVEYDTETQAILNKKNASMVVMIVSYILTVVFIAGAIAAAEYPKYLESDKYSAKLKRKKKAEKFIENQKNVNSESKA